VTTTDFEKVQPLAMRSIISAYIKQYFRDTIEFILRKVGLSIWAIYKKTK